MFPETSGLYSISCCGAAKLARHDDDVCICMPISTAWWIVSRPGYSIPAPDRKFTRIHYSIPGIKLHLYPGNWGMDPGCKLLDPRSWIQDPGIQPPIPKIEIHTSSWDRIMYPVELSIRGRDRVSGSGYNPPGRHQPHNHAIRHYYSAPHFDHYL